VAVPSQAAPAQDGALILAARHGSVARRTTTRRRRGARGTRQKRWLSDCQPEIRCSDRQVRSSATDNINHNRDVSANVNRSANVIATST
jgi:hypothetical protein